MNVSPSVSPTVSPRRFQEEVGAEAAEEELDALTLLERQHEENQRQVALIRAELGLG